VDDDGRREERGSDKWARHEGPHKGPMVDEWAWVVHDHDGAASGHDDHTAIPGVGGAGQDREDGGQDEGERKTSAHGEPPSGRLT
jgi:hypothetical protein